MEASAKTGINAQNVFIEAAKVLFDDYLKYKGKIEQKTGPTDIKPMSQFEGGQKLEVDKKKDEKKCGC